MPRNDPNKIDVERALWLYRVIKRDWRFVAAELKLLTKSEAVVELETTIETVSCSLPRPIV